MCTCFHCHSWARLTQLVLDSGVGDCCQSLLPSPKKPQHDEHKVFHIVRWCLSAKACQHENLHWVSQCYSMELESQNEPRRLRITSERESCSCGEKTLRCHFPWRVRRLMSLGMSLGDAAHHHPYPLGIPCEWKKNMEDRGFYSPNCWVSLWWWIRRRFLQIAGRLLHGDAPPGKFLVIMPFLAFIHSFSFLTSWWV